MGADGGPHFELREELRCDPVAVRPRLVGFVRDQLATADLERVVLGLSGGVDSALVAHLVAEAIGPDRLVCVLLPYRTSAPASRSDAELVARGLGCVTDLVDISPVVDAYFAERPEAPVLRRGNFMARTRMAVLYDRSAELGALVAGTGNKTEALIGYTTMYGDNAYAFNPIGDLYKSQVRQLALAVGVPQAIIRKPPSADLWPGQTDEAESGIAYPVLDRVLQLLVDEERSVDGVVAEGFERSLVDRVAGLIAASAFKRALPPVARLIRSRHAHLDHG